MHFFARSFLSLFLLIALPFQTAAQTTEIPFGNLRQDTSLPVEISAERLEVDQAEGTAMFSGNVVVGQGDMRLKADRIQVIYAAGDDRGRIARLEAAGNVVLVSGAEAAEAERAIYTIESGQVVMEGNVILTQGGNALSSERMLVNLKDGTALLEGRVRTILNPGGN